MEQIIAAILCGIIAVVCFIFGVLQLGQKGFLFNNAYIFASKEEREAMDKKPYYRQSGIVFVLLGAINSVNALEALINSGWLFCVGIGLAVVTVVYAVVSSVKLK